MNRRIFGLVLLALFVWMLTTIWNSSKAISSPDLSNYPARIEPVTLVAQENSTDTASDESKPSDEIRCQITLLTDERFNCAKVYGIDGQVRMTNENSDDKNDLQPIEKADSFKRHGLLRKPEALLRRNGWNAIKAEDKDAKATLLFNNLNFVKASGQAMAEIEFKKGNYADKLSLDTIKLVLDLDKIVVSNAAMDPDKDTSQASAPANVTNQQGALADLSRLPMHEWFWQSAKARLIGLRRALLPQNFFSEPAFANSVDPSILDFPAHRVTTPEVTLDSNGAVYVLERNDARRRTQVFSLTNEPIKLTDSTGSSTIMSRNQTAVITDTGLTEAPFEFPLCGFYRNNRELLEGLAPNDVDFVRQQPRDLQFGYHGARSLTIPLYHKNCQKRCAPRGSGF